METLDEYIDERTAEWHDAQINSCCSCHKFPPCDHCVEGFSLTLAEFVEQCVLDYEDHHGWKQSEPTHDRYDRAMKDLF